MLHVTWRFCMLFKTLAYLLLILVILSRPDATFRYAYEGLYQWAAKMVPRSFLYDDQLHYGIQWCRLESLAVCANVF